MNSKDETIQRTTSTLDRARNKRKKIIQNLNRGLADSKNNGNNSSISTNAYSDSQYSLQSSKISEPRFQDVSKLMHNAPKLKDESEIENIDPE